MQNTLPGILVNATRIVVSKFVGLETTRRIQMRMKTEDPGAPEPTPLPCYEVVPTNSEQLEDAIYILISELAAEIIGLMALNPGVEFATLVWVTPEGSLTAQAYMVGPDGVGYFDTLGLDYSSVVAMIHGHPSVANTSEGTYPLYTPSLPGYALMPGAVRTLTVNGVARTVGDWLTFDYFKAQITAAGGRPDLFRQYIVGYGAYPNQRPAWHLVEPNASARKDSSDYANDPVANPPAPSLPIGVQPPQC